MTFYGRVVLGLSIHETRLWASCHVPHLRAQISSWGFRGLRSQVEHPRLARHCGHILW